MKPDERPPLTLAQERRESIKRQRRAAKLLPEHDRIRRITVPVEQDVVAEWTP